MADMLVLETNEETHMGSSPITPIKSVSLSNCTTIKAHLAERRRERLKIFSFNQGMGSNPIVGIQIVVMNFIQ